MLLNLTFEGLVGAMAIDLIKMNVSIETIAVGLQTLLFELCSCKGLSSLRGVEIFCFVNVDSWQINASTGY